LVFDICFLINSFNSQWNSNSKCSFETNICFTKNLNLFEYFNWKCIKINQIFIWIIQFFNTLASNWRKSYWRCSGIPITPNVLHNRSQRINNTFSSWKSSVCFAHSLIDFVFFHWIRTSIGSNWLNINQIG